MTTYAQGDKVLYIGGEALNTVGEPMIVRTVLDSLGDVYELERTAGGLLWGISADTIRPDSETERAASAARVAAAVEHAVARRDWRRARITELKDELGELEIEESWLDPDPVDVAERERAVQMMLLAEGQAAARRR